MPVQSLGTDTCASGSLDSSGNFILGVISLFFYIGISTFRLSRRMHKQQWHSDSHQRISLSFTRIQAATTRDRVTRAARTRAHSHVSPRTTAKACAHAGGVACRPARADATRTWPPMRYSVRAEADVCIRSSMTARWRWCVCVCVSSHSHYRDMQWLWESCQRCYASPRCVGPSPSPRVQQCPRGWPTAAA